MKEQQLKFTAAVGEVTSFFGCRGPCRAGKKNPVIGGKKWGDISAQHSKVLKNYTVQSGVLFFYGIVFLISLKDIISF